MKQGSGADQGLRLAPDHQRTSVIGDFTLISGVAETLDQFLLYHIHSSLDTITLTILQRVRVIATGTDMGYLASSSSGQNYAARSYSTVTLELTPKEVEMIIFASQKGRLTMSLRNYEESAITQKLQSVNWNFLQKNIMNYNAEREKMMRAGR